jgi:hypothetical protein
MQSVMVCYDSKCPTWLKYNLNHVYISSWTLSPHKSVFKGDFYPSFVSFGIRSEKHVTSSSHERGNL